MTTSLIKAILFDYGGVLAEEGFRDGLLAMAREQHLDVEAIPSAAMQAVYDSGFVLGKGTATEFWALLKARTGLSGEEAVLTQRILDGFILRPWMIRLVEQLRAQGYITGLLSDQTHWLDELDARDHFFVHFDHIFNSYYLGKGKRTPGLFTGINSRLGLSPNEILFIDDSELNIHNAHKARWQTIHYVNKAQFLDAIAPMLRVKE